MTVANKFLGVLILAGACAVPALAQHSSSARQTVTFGVIRAHSLQPAAAFSRSTEQGLVKISGGAMAKVTLSTEPQPKSFEGMSNRREGISVGAPISAEEPRRTGFAESQVDIRTFGESGKPYPTASQPVVITITE